MAGRSAVYEKGPLTFEVFAAVTGQSLVVPGTAGNAAKVGPAGLSAINVLGVALEDGLPAGTDPNTTSVDGFPVLNTSLVSQYIAVGRRGVYKLKAGGSFVMGDDVKAGAAGVVVKFVEGTDTLDMKIGQCVDPLGGTNGGTSLVDINLG